jgi:hypothetical protein
MKDRVFMPITATQTTLLILGEQYFDHGYLCGRSWYFHGDTPEKPVTWEDVVSFIKDNMVDLALEGFLDDERLADNA